MDRETIGVHLDNEALVPHSHEVLGLKLSDAEEATTVRRMGRAALGLTVLLVVHFLVNRVVYGHTLHAAGHLLVASMLPAMGYVAVSQRSPKAAWAFTVMATVSVIVHLMHLAFVLDPRLLLGPGGPCARFAQPCTGSPAEAPLPAAYSKDHNVWRCSPSNLCIHGHNRCDHNVNCFDASDEMGCHPGGDDMWRVVLSPNAKQIQERCQHLIMAAAQSPRLKVWWVMMSPPMCGLCVFAAYYGLEFYVQLRVRRLSARIVESVADATVFERAPGAMQSASEVDDAGE